ncbi:MAG TPA: vitamin B12-dependent ribonucleotide reductase, partial [Terriglobales bacterium]|nr:vitamin B12-dependent ribonucleotide reductase [Terriglobales bacterium]
AKSIMDYIFRWLQLRFLTGQQQMLFENLRIRSGAQTQPSLGDMGDASTEANVGRASSPAMGNVHAADALRDIVDMGDAPSCSFCGSIMTRNGSCYRCMSCGSTSGCS